MITKSHYFVLPLAQGKEQEPILHYLQSTFSLSDDLAEALTFALTQSLTSSGSSLSLHEGPYEPAQLDSRKLIDAYSSPPPPSHHLKKSLHFPPSHEPGLTFAQLESLAMRLFLWVSTAELER